MSADSSSIEQLPPERIVDNLPTVRTLKAYSLVLRFDPEYLRGKSVLDVGSGLSDLQADCGELGITTSIYEVDIMPRPLTPRLDRWVLGAKNGGSGHKLFSQARATRLPFPNELFDLVLSNSCLYQIPSYRLRVRAIQEMMRVAQKAIHVGPIYKHEWDEIIKAVSENGFETVFSMPFAGSDFPLTPEQVRESKRFTIDRLFTGRPRPLNQLLVTGDYSYVFLKSAKERYIQPPKLDKPPVIRALGTLLGANTDDDRGVTMILARRTFLDSIG